jgi:hypothetical protein
MPTRAGQPEGLAILSGMDLALLLAHLGHYTWALYAPAVLIVLFSIIRTVIAQRRERDGG